MLKINYLKKRVHVNYPLTDDMYLIGDINGIRIFYSNTMVNFAGTFGGAQGKYVSNEILEKYEDVNEMLAHCEDVIYIDDYGMKDEIREFLIFHEYGHLIRSHTEIINNLGLEYHRMRAENSEITINLELEADSTAVEAIGAQKSYEALTSMKEELHKRYPDFISVEVEQRLQAVRKCM